MMLLLKLIEHGQQFWLDNLTREMMKNGSLARRVRSEGLGGVTSNPVIFYKAIAAGRAYDADIKKAGARGLSAGQTYEQLVTDDVRRACDILRSVYDKTDGESGFVSLEVSPHLAHDAIASVKEAHRFWVAVNRPNLFIKIPGTAAGMEAIETLTYEGVNVNVTLLFSLERYQDAADAYMKGLERRVRDGLEIKHVASVASFFVSRIDTAVDALLQDKPQSKSLVGAAALASAKLAYARFKALLAGDRGKALERSGGRPQRMLWASTGTKNPAYSDTKYVEGLVGPLTINTMPEATAAAFADHGVVEDMIEEGIDEAKATVVALEERGIDMRSIVQKLLDEGLEQFRASYDALLQLIFAKQHGDKAKQLAVMADKLRRLVIRMTSAAGSGHPTSCMSAAEIVATLFFHEMRWDPRLASARNADRFVLSKGHAAPILWAALAEAGAIRENLMTLRKMDSTLEGHPTPRNPWSPVATGSLGQGLSAANGITLANRLDGVDARVYCLMGDGECAEGSVWEAAQFAALHKLSNVIAIVDANGLGQSGPAPDKGDPTVLARRFESFGWKSIVVDGHDIHALVDAFDRAREGGPTAIVAKTMKGKGVSFLEGKEGWHGKALDKESMKRALKELGSVTVNLRVAPRRVGKFDVPVVKRSSRITVPYKKGEMVATRTAYGHMLRSLGAQMPTVVALDGDVKNSTFAEYFAQDFPDRFFESYIAEQNMVGVALGLAVSGKVPFVSTFAAFLSRAYDFIRMAAYSRPAHLIFCGSHAGISIGEDGPSQMGLEDIAIFRAIIGSTIFYPCDAVSAARLTALAAEVRGIVYLRMSRPKTPVIYSPGDKFVVGGSKALRTSKNDRMTLVGAGVTVHEALSAYEGLKKKGIAVRVIDAYSVKPLDVTTLLRAARETGQIVVIEDHSTEGGLGDSVAAAVGGVAPVHRLGIGALPQSGSSDELMDRYGISHKAILRYVQTLS